jgi:thiol-disulfide isomerase/thioredoxin
VVGPPDFLGKVVVMDLWATWCGPCRLQARYLDQLHAEYGDQVQFLAIDVGEDEATVRRFAEKNPFPYPVLLDPSESIQQRFRSTGLPTVMVIDTLGRVSYLNVGVANPATLRREIAKAQQGGVAQGSV